MSLPLRRNHRSPYILSVRPLEPSDLHLLRSPSTANKRLSRLRDVHHIIARLMASGLTNIEIASRVGYTRERISHYRGDPSVQDLVAQYRTRIDEKWLEGLEPTYDMMTEARGKYLRTIIDHHDSAEEAGEPVPLLVALKVFDSMADRTNYHRKTAKESVNVNFAANLEAAISRSREVRVIDSEASE